MTAKMARLKPSAKRRSLSRPGSQISLHLSPQANRVALFLENVSTTNVASLSLQRAAMITMRKEKRKRSLKSQRNIRKTKRKRSPRRTKKLRKEQGPGKTLQLKKTLTEIKIERRDGCLLRETCGQADLSRTNSSTFFKSAENYQLGRLVNKFLTWSTSIRL